MDLLSISSHVYRIFGYDVSIGELSFSLVLVVLLSSVLLLARHGAFNFADKGADVSRGLRREQATEVSIESICSPVQESDERVLNPLSFRRFTVISIENASHNTVTVRFEIPTGKDLGLSVGRHVSARAEINGIKVLRPYTPTSRPDTKGHFELLVKKYADGKMSTHIGNLRVGDTLEFRGPVGRFKYTKNQYTRIGLIAGGTGLTPCLQVIRSVLEGPEGQGDETAFILFFQNRTEQDILLRNELQLLASAFPSRLKVFFFVSNPRDEAWGTEFAKGKGFKSCMTGKTNLGKIPEVRGYISSAAVKALLRPEDSQLVGMCGPSGFNEAMKALLLEEGHVDSSLFIW